MKIACMGGGPAGLYFAISLKLREPQHEITVFERNKRGDTFGWGVVFSDQTMDYLRTNDEISARKILDEFAHWDDIDVHFKDQVITSGGHGFCGISRQRLLDILAERAEELGVQIQFAHEVSIHDEALKDYDLIIASDGINSKVREEFASQFKVDIETRANKFVWLGTHKLFKAFKFIFKHTPHGWIWAHAYRFNEDTSTFIPECSQQTFDSFGFADMSQNEIIAVLEDVFKDELDGHKLLSNASHLRGAAIWLNFRRVLCETWHYKNIILLGDAAHTAHFSIGSGTKLAFEDAIKLAEVLCRHDVPVEEALELYQDERHLEALKLQSAARNSTEWFENMERYSQMEPVQFAYSLLTRSQRVSHENLRLRDPEWLEGVENWFYENATGYKPNVKTPPMFTPFHLRDMKLENRIIVSPMCMYSAQDGMPNDFHFTHLTSRAMGGAGLVFTEMTNISPDARISPGCAGIWSQAHADAWATIVKFVHEQTKAKIGMQLGHAGRKGATKLSWEGNDEPLDEGAWPIYGPSPIPWSDKNQIPIPMTRADMDRVVQDYIRATEFAVNAGFDIIELHAAHGYLLSSFLTPLSNQRDDEYGGSLENRLRFPLEVMEAVRATWPQDKPMSVRISAHDWVAEDGIDDVEAMKIGQAFVDAGADIIDVSAGQTSTSAKPVYGRMFQTPFSDRIRNQAGLATIAVGNIYEIDHVNSILAAGRADLVCMARPHLMDPYWTLRAAAEQGYDGVKVPPQYQAGFDQMKRNFERAGQMALLV
ncbi:MAG: bifunctional salicylyl-CoA 5-hydroxylase/oxidoreductase [Sphingomonadales bacterium]